MFTIIDENVFYKEGKMQDALHFGRLYIARTTDIENQLEIMKFDIEQKEYLHCDELNTFEIEGKSVAVVSGFATAVLRKPEPPPPAVVSTNEIMGRLQAQEEDNLSRDEILLEQQLLLLNINLNTSTA